MTTPTSSDDRDRDGITGTDPDLTVAEEGDEPIDDGMGADAPLDVARRSSHRGGA